MASISDIISSLINKKKKIDVSKLPSQGFFYKDNFEIYIRKATMEEVIDYEYQYDKENLGLMIFKIKKIIKTCSTLSKGYTFEDIKAIDIMYLFLEIVKFTNNSKITIPYFDDKNGYQDNIEFDSKYFNYFEITTDLMSKYNDKKNEFSIYGYGFSLPSIGVENSITEYIASKSKNQDAEKYKYYSYDFIYFLGGKTRLSFSEIDNLVTIFNIDLDKEEQDKVKEIVETFTPIFKYSLKKDEKVIDLNSKLDLATIWH